MYASGAPSLYPGRQSAPARLPIRAVAAPPGRGVQLGQFLVLHADIRFAGEDVRSSQQALLAPLV